MKIHHIKERTLHDAADLTGTLFRKECVYLDIYNIEMTYQ